MTNDNNTPIDTTDVTTIPLHVAATDATVTTAGNITASTAAATTSTILPAGNAADETTRRSLFGAGLYQTVLNEIRESLEEEVSELNFPRSPRDSRPRAAAVAGSGSSPSL
ncbi:hypothetical protein F2Q69_00010998 [Brassica cretica]|uniref:Uncharacterized protein n=1 Tax=Brassica cretica TaxID=69181 RepID=A0A8S9R8U2_BRACR|nr:hypothetical protein F2Q69_00010998 [Brassica cretica]